ncbi:hypothetical protein DENSPDRAFT_866215 [Dentipellis sp. KUC8613]|nr:hypothetical protein DENSPDRAFT_866215 [Dentipellis sp. KUC8613]
MSMFAQMPMRSSNSIILYLSRKEPPPLLPIELQGHVGPETWAMRIPALTMLASRFHKPIFEGLWLLAAFIASIAVPAAVYPTIFHALDKDDNGNSRFRDDQPFFQARAATVGIFIGVSLLFWVPLLVWKMIGQSRANALVRRWSEDDLRLKGPSAFIPVWKMNMPSFWNSSARLTVSLPPSQAPTTFHPAAYLPSWINGPTDPAAGMYYYPVQNGPGSQLQPNIAGNAGVYGDEKAPAYTGGEAAEKVRPYR